ncbi:MAG: glycosyltransferase family 2 protein [Gemmatimonadaceae bacterium]
MPEERPQPQQTDSSPQPVASGAPSFGAVVLNWNSARETMECVEALERADTPPDHVVVVDNGSDDDSVERLEAWADEHWIWRLSTGTSGRLSRQDTPWLVIARAGANRGFAGGTNVGIRYLEQRTTVSHFVLLNSGATIAAEFFAEIARAIEQNPLAGLLSGTIFEDPPRDRVWYAGGVAHPLRALIRHKYEVPDSSEAVPTDFITGCAMVISRTLLDRIGLLAECYFPEYWEDGEYSLRAREAGFPVLYVPKATVYRKPPEAMTPDVGLALDQCRNRLRVFYVRRNYRGLRKAAALGYLAVTKPGRALVETVKGHPKSGWAILTGTIEGFVSSTAKR